MKLLDRSRAPAPGSGILPRPRRVALAAASSALMITLTAASAMAAAPAPPPSADGPAPDATVVLVRALTSAEIQSRGLTQFLQAGATGQLAPGTAAAATPKSAAASSGCWTASVKQPGWLGMNGYGSEDWCGSGGWITYAARACWGSDGWYPTYNYLGCSMSAFYGKGWNVADTQYNWDMCIAWWGGGCAKHRHLWDRFRFTATGGTQLISHGG
jgi:hypothetical protein